MPTLINRNKRGITMSYTQDISPAIPCMVCERAHLYAEFGPDRMKHTDCIIGGNNITIIGNFGSAFDGNVFEAILCDVCLDKMVQSKRLIVKTEEHWFGDDVK